MELRRFSHSLIDCFLDCPRKAYYRYVEEIPSPKSAALVKGSACDEAWNEALQAKLTGEDALSVDAIKEITELHFRDDVRAQGGKSAVDWGESNATDALASALRLSEQWAKGLYPAIEPTAVQVQYDRELPSGRQFIGFVDFEGSIDGVGPVVADNKTGGRKLSPSEADKGLQPYAYAWLKGEAIQFVFARAVDTGKSQSTEFVWTGRNDGDVTWYDDLVTAVERQWEAEIWPTNPKSNLCGAKFCPYFAKCQPHRVVTGPSSTPR